MIWDYTEQDQDDTCEKPLHKDEDGYILTDKGIGYLAEYLANRKSREEE